MFVENNEVANVFYILPLGCGLGNVCLMTCQCKIEKRKKKE